MSFKDISYPELWQPLCSVEQDHLCNSIEGIMRNNYVMLFLNVDQWFRRRCHLKIFLIKSSDTIVRFGRGIMANICMKLFKILTSGSGIDVVERKSLCPTNG